MDNKSGFTLPEILIVSSLLVILAGVVLGNVFSLRQNVSISTSIDTIIADMKDQQTKAMVGDTEGGASAGSYGVYFETGRYTLFHGSAYSTGNTSNFVVNLDSSIQFSNVTFPGSVIVFNSQSGQINGFTPGSNTITVKDRNSTKQKTITINRYGVVTSIN